MSAEVEMVTVPGVEGDFGVLVAHAPVITTLRPGVLVVKGTSGEEQRIFDKFGYLRLTQMTFAAASVEIRFQFRPPLLVVLDLPEMLPFASK